MTEPILAITMGDPGGIGPEIIAKALTHADVYERSRPLIIGERRAMVSRPPPSLIQAEKETMGPTVRG